MDHDHPKEPIQLIAELMDRLGDKLIAAVGHFTRSMSSTATKQDLHELGNKLMSAISDFVTKQNAVNDQIDAAVTGLTSDIKNLSDQITQLQNSPGTITPADQALLDGIEARTKTIADKLTALDAVTPPVAPPTP
jgi:cob(I)alamin adenosyltransferase